MNVLNTKKEFVYGNYILRTMELEDHIFAYVTFRDQVKIEERRFMPDIIISGSVEGNPQDWSDFNFGIHNSAHGLLSLEENRQMISAEVDARTAVFNFMEQVENYKNEKEGVDQNEKR